MFFDSSVHATIAEENEKASFFLYGKMSTEIEHGWNDNHRSDDRVDVARESERERERQEKKKEKI